jgi:hypothetical protein
LTRSSLSVVPPVFPRSRSSSATSSVARSSRRASTPTRLLLTVPPSRPVSFPERPPPPRLPTSSSLMSSLSPSVLPWRVTSSPLSFPVDRPSLPVRIPCSLFSFHPVSAARAFRTPYQFFYISPNPVHRGRFCRICRKVKKTGAEVPCLWFHRLSARQCREDLQDTLTDFRHLAPLIASYYTLERFANHEPLVKKRTFTTVADNQQTVQFPVFQGERVNCEDNTSLGEFTLAPIPPMKVLCSLASNQNIFTDLILGRRRCSRGCLRGRRQRYPQGHRHREDLRPQRQHHHLQRRR